MFYYSVWVRSNRYHNSEPLTYASTLKIRTGSIVQVELQRELVLGIVSGTTTKPRFKTKELARVYDLPTLPQHTTKLMEWLPTYYPAPVGVVTQQFLPPNLTEKNLTPSEESAEPLTFEVKDLPQLNKEQTSAVEAMQAKNTYILHGKTGSGKTRVYIELALQTLADGRSAIILTPEISLTTQLADRFREVFSERVIVMHSGQTPAERQRAWLKILRSRHPLIVIGPRSALFSPVEKLGLIVIDEAHEPAYKQESQPGYQTGRLASYLTQITPSRLIIGSATPLISDYFMAKTKQKPIIELKELATENDFAKTSIQIIDRKDHSQFSRSPFLSFPLIKAIEQALSKQEQTLLYLNRRGTAKLVMCENCGWQALCPNCDVPLTYHGDKHQLRCHSCSHHQTAPSSCPICKHPNIIYKSAGTKAIMDEISRLFPSSKAARFDTDNTKTERFEQKYEQIKNGEVDILVGTQLLAKGIDLPRLSTLGIVLADTSLYMPDYTAEERTFQLISQVLGRIGRGHIGGTAFIQTYHPDNPVLLRALDSNYADFYDTEIKSRQNFLFPPYSYILKLTARRSSLASVESAANKLKQIIEESGHKVRVEGPAPSFYERFQNKYQWQLIVKARDRGELLKVISELPTGWSYDLDPLDLL